MAVRKAGGIEYELVRRKGMRNVRASVKEPDGHVRVSAPMNTPLAFIDDFVASHAAWIESRRRAMAERPARMPKAYADGEQVSLWGDELTLRVRRGPRSRCSVSRVGDEVVIHAPAGADESALEAAYERFLRRELEKALAAAVPACEERTGLKCSGWSIRKMETRWGSCTYASGRIRFALKLACYPPECLEMVVIHELGHLRHHGHGADFKAYMDEHCPAWREARKLLK